MSGSHVHDVDMTNWTDVATATPDLAAEVRARFEAHRLGFLATLRTDGSPRISGIEPWFAHDEVWLGMMPGSTKARDLQRDPRLELHSASVDPQVGAGDARIAGHAVEVLDPDRQARAMAAFEEVSGFPPPPGPFHLFAIDVRSLVLLRTASDHLVIRTWDPERGDRSIDRY